MARDSKTLRVVAESENQTRTRIRAGRHEMLTDEPEVRGGTDESFTPMQGLLGAQAGCLNVTAHKVASDMGIEIRSLDIEIRAEYVPHRDADESEDIRAGFEEITASIEVDIDADEEAVQEWTDRTEAECPVTENIQHPTPAALSVTLV